ncbi:hypothetical protein, partial [Streptomyces sp. C1-2]|uniref:hypothetical protein n=1 Tax=Streptomyces sp. C1-2 TaxID=2720022 RepID=UPI003211F7FC
MTWVGETLVILLAGLVPKVTAVVPDRFVPVIVTNVPPPVDPWFGEMGMERLLADRNRQGAAKPWALGADLRGRVAR